jgi:thiol-disulfide isomerase/thioredoxin
MYPGTQQAAVAPPEGLLRAPAGADAGAALLLMLLMLLTAPLLSGCGGAGPVADERPAADAAADAPAETSDAATVARLELADGSVLPVDAFDGSWLFVNYWAEWCAPCLEEIPELNELEHDVDGARVLGINFDRLDAAVIREQMETLGIAFPVAVGDADSALGLQPPEVLPSTFVFAPDGAQQGVLRGPQTLDMLRAAMRSMDDAERG